MEGKERAVIAVLSGMFAQEAQQTARAEKETLQALGERRAALGPVLEEALGREPPASLTQAAQRRWWARALEDAADEGIGELYQLLHKRAEQEARRLEGLALTIDVLLEGINAQSTPALSEELSELADALGREGEAKSPATLTRAAVRAKLAMAAGLDRACLAASREGPGAASKELAAPVAQDLAAVARRPFDELLGTLEHHITAARAQGGREP